jgi:large subunit ribosomal protein L37Ae
MTKKYRKKGRKTRSAGRFGPRYGRKIRKLVADIEEQTYAPHKCPRCGRPGVHRIGTGIWKCSRCDLVFSGGAYIPQTSMGKNVEDYVKKAMGR